MTHRISAAASNVATIAGRTPPGAPRRGAEALRLIDLADVLLARNVRSTLDAQRLAELTESVRQVGVLQPILVRPRGLKFEVIAGGRRVRAARAAGLSRVPAYVRPASDAEVAELQLVENVQREGLDPLEEAAGYRRLRDEFGHTAETIAALVGKSRSYVFSVLRLCALPEATKEAVREGRITKSVAIHLTTVHEEGGRERLTAELSKAAEGGRPVPARGAGARIKEARGVRAEPAPVHREDYREEWLRHLVGFTVEQFLRLQRILRGRWSETDVAEAVDLVVRENVAASNGAGIEGRQ